MMVLLFTNKEDVTTDFIIQELKKQVIEFYRFNTEELSKTVEIVLDFERERYSLIDKLDNKEYNILDFTDIYYRRPELPSYDGAGLTEGERSFLQTEIYYTLEGVYRLLSKKHWFNNVYAIRNAENKIYQLLLAKEVGLTIPSTLISNHYVLISLYRYQVYHCNRYHASAAIGTACIAANGTKFIGSA